MTFCAVFASDVGNGIKQTSAKRGAHDAGCPRPKEAVAARLSSSRPKLRGELHKGSSIVHTSSSSRTSRPCVWECHARVAQLRRAQGYSRWRCARTTSKFHRLSFNCSIAASHQSLVATSHSELLLDLASWVAKPPCHCRPCAILLLPWNLPAL